LESPHNKNPSTVEHWFDLWLSFAIKRYCKVSEQRFNDVAFQFAKLLEIHIQPLGYGQLRKQGETMDPGMWRSSE
jgi:hypothetical protein